MALLQPLTWVCYHKWLTKQPPVRRPSMPLVPRPHSSQLADIQYRLVSHCCDSDLGVMEGSQGYRMVAQPNVNDVMVYMVNEGGG